MYTLTQRSHQLIKQKRCLLSLCSDILQFVFNQLNSGYPEIIVVHQVLEKIKLHTTRRHDIRFKACFHLNNT